MFGICTRRTLLQLRRHRFVQALRFSHYVLGVDGANLCITSRRVVGSAELQLATKEPTRQARALTVAEVKRLHSVTTCQTTDLQQKLSWRCICCSCCIPEAGQVILPMFRKFCTMWVWVTNLLEGLSLSRYRPGITSQQKNVEKKNLLLPILASGTSVVEDAWLVTWLKLRRQAGLKVAGEFHGAIQPAPDLSKEGQWLRRPLTCSETTLMLRSLLGCQDKNLTSHSLKNHMLIVGGQGRAAPRSEKIVGETRVGAARRRQCLRQGPGLCSCQGSPTSADPDQEWRVWSWSEQIKFFPILPQFFNQALQLAWQM